MEDMYDIRQGDCREVMREMPDNSVDAIVTDPPYGLSFMGKEWDHGVPGVQFWTEAIRVAKPGAHLLAFGGTRTFHRLTCAIEDAGWEIRDCVMWVYGCLDEVTEVATAHGSMPYHKAKTGDLVLCYNPEHGEYTYQPILKIVEYDYSDTAYRLVGDFGEQVVTRNHRVIVERGGSEVFQLAETLECEARVPILESLPALRKALHDAHQGTGRSQQSVRRELCEGVDWRSECRGDATGTAQGYDYQLRGLRGKCVEAECVVAQGSDTDLQQGMQRRASWRGVGRTRAQGADALVGRVEGCLEGAYDGRIEPGVEGWGDLSESEGRVCESADQVRALPSADAADGAVRRLRDGVPPGGCVSDQSAANEIGVCSPHQPRRNGQPGTKPNAVRNERTAQGVRAWGGHRSAVVRVMPFHYTGKVWCLRVPTGAFVAVRDGVAFPTGNSGFPKSHDVSKAIDKAAGAEREVVGVAGKSGSVRNSMAGDFAGGEYMATAPATDAARQWAGWGTALKPAWEPIIIARKPLIGTVAENVMRHGTGGINVDGCRVEGKPRTTHADGNYTGNSSSSAIFPMANIKTTEPQGRWPANVIHDGSDEVVGLFPETGPSKSSARGGTNPNPMDWGNERADAHVVKGHNDNGGSAARFFYVPKASKADRDAGCEGLAAIHRANGNKWTDQDHRVTNGERPPSAESGPRRNHHPTVKPTELMRYLCRLVTPPGGVVLDPFMGSGSTGKAAILEGFRFIGIDLNPEYIEIARARIKHALNDKKGFSDGQEKLF